MPRSLLGRALVLCAKVGPTPAKLHLLSVMTAQWESSPAKIALGASPARQANTLSTRRVVWTVKVGVMRLELSLDRAYCVARVHILIRRAARRAKLAGSVWLKHSSVNFALKESRALQPQRRVPHVPLDTILQAKALLIASHVLQVRTRRLQHL